jgi:hypothetical integral membrane protein (TIGR02206 family)
VILNWLIGKDFPGAPFTPFSPAHFGILAGLALAILLTLRWARGFSPQGRRRFRTILAIWMSIDFLGWQLWNVLAGSWSLQEMLPLHLCTVTGLMAIALLWVDNQFLYEIVYFLGTLGAFITLTNADIGIFNFPHYLFFQIFFSHGCIIFTALYMTLIEGFRPRKSSLLRVAVSFNLYLPLVYAVNWLLNANYVFVTHKPEFPSPLDLLSAWPWYILEVEAIGAIFCLLLYLPFARKFAGKLATNRRLS